MKASEILQDALKSTNIQNKEICNVIGIQPNSFSKKLTNNSFRAQELVDLLDAMGMEIKLIHRNTGSPVPLHIRGTGPRVVSIIDGEPFDTKHASAVCYSDIESGRYRELYRESNEKFFIVHYSVWDNEKPVVTACSPETAADFFNKCRCRHCPLFEQVLS